MELVQGSASNEDVNRITNEVIKAGIEVHRLLGPGLFEATYDSAMKIEFDAARIRYEHQPRIPAYYKDRLIGEYRIDFIVEDQSSSR